MGTETGKATCSLVDDEPSLPPVMNVPLWHGTGGNSVMDTQGFGEALIDWYQRYRRDLPWRNIKDAYAVWLSEIMLQQTQVNTVIPYYEKFLTLFPTVKDLADAPLEKVLKAWEGLGYYARCRNLHKTAQRVAEEYDGQFPRSITEMEKLPGIGRSTAGAILTFSGNGAYPILDGNVKRVLSRLYDIDADMDRPETLKQLWQFSGELLEATGNPYDFNQAIMELGATLCVPKDPACLVCPVHAFCQAAAHGTQHERPRRSPPKTLPHYTIAVGVIWREGKVLIQRRPEQGLLGGLWEFPGGKQELGESLEETTAREIREELGLTVAVEQKIMSVKHAYTHFKITLHAFQCRYLSGEPQPVSATAWQWVEPDDLEQFAFPKANKAILKFLTSSPSIYPSPLEGEGGL